MRLDDGRDYGLVMVRGGHCEDFGWKYPHPRSKEYMKAQHKAQKEKRGIWSAHSGVHNSGKSGHSGGLSEKQTKKVFRMHATELQDCSDQHLDDVQTKDMAFLIRIRPSGKVESVSCEPKNLSETSLGKCWAACIAVKQALGYSIKLARASMKLLSPSGASHGDICSRPPGVLFTAPRSWRYVRWNHLGRCRSWPRCFPGVATLPDDVREN